MKRWVILLALLAAWTVEGRELSLSEALDLAESHSFGLKQAGAQWEAARAAAGAARAERFPAFSATGLVSYVSEIPTLDINIPPNISFSREMGTDQNYQADLRISLPLYTGGRLGGAIGKASAIVDYYNALKESDLDRLHYITRQTYLQLNRADLAVVVAEASLRRAEIIYDDMLSMHAAGAADSVDILEVQLALSKAELAVEASRTQRRSAELQLLTLLGLPTAEGLNLTSSPTEPKRPELEDTPNVEKPELVAAEAMIASAREDLQIARADHFPTLAAFGGYSYGKPNLDRFNNTWNDYFTVGATLTWSFSFGGGTGRKVAAAGHRLDFARHERGRIEEGLSREASLAGEDLKLAYQRFLTAGEEYRITEASYRLAEKKHKEGALSTNRRLEIETNLTAATSALSAALVDYHMSLNTYRYLTAPSGLREEL